MSGRSLTEVLDELDAHERPIVQSLSFDALRKWVRSHELIKEFIPKNPPPEVDRLDPDHVGGSGLRELPPSDPLAQLARTVLLLFLGHAPSI